MGKVFDDNNENFKLENLERKSIHHIPEGYFDELPAIIQSRIQANTPQKTRGVFGIPSFYLKAALVPAAIILTILFYNSFLKVDDFTTSEEILAEVSVEDIIQYLDYSEITTDDILAELSIEDDILDEFLDNDIHLLNENEINSIELYELYEEYGLDEANM